MSSGKGILLLTLALGVICTKLTSADVIQTAASTEIRYGAHIDSSGWVNFVVYAPDATQVEVALFNRSDDQIPNQLVPMIPSGTDWKVRVKGVGVGVGTPYMYRASGPNSVLPPQTYGPMFNSNYMLNDPYAFMTQNVTASAFFNSDPLTDITNSVYAGGGKSIVFDHGTDSSAGHVRVAPEDLILYELHVQDYTSRLNGLRNKPGSYLALIERGLNAAGQTAGFDHLVELGVNAIELMPILEYDEETGDVPGRYNHWGYQPTNVFSPEARYTTNPGHQVEEVKQLVKAFHEQNIAVFLDVVYNHTGEEAGSVVGNKVRAKYYNFRGLANGTTYRASPDGTAYLNDSGAGNTINFLGDDQQYTKRWVRDSLNLWFGAYGIDGFRFDLAEILADGSPNAADWVDNDPRYSAAHLHAEPWNGHSWLAFMDSGGWDYTNNRWAKWAGGFRDNARLFSKSDLRNRSAFKQLIEGRSRREDGGDASSKPWRSVNYLAIHDGYTLRDCVWFQDPGNNCWNSNGDENLRRQREKLLLGLLFTAQGVPLLQQGDEFGFSKSRALSQADAANSYNYEAMDGNKSINKTNWLDWQLKAGNNGDTPNGPTYGKELFVWTKNLIALRKHWSHFRRKDFAEYVSDSQHGGVNVGPRNDGKYTYSWEGIDGQPIQIAVIWWGKAGEPDIMALYNEDWNQWSVTNLGDWSNGDWRLLASSWETDGRDFCPLSTWQHDCPTVGQSLMLPGRAMAILISTND